MLELKKSLDAKVMLVVTTCMVRRMTSTISYCIRHILTILNKNTYTYERSTAEIDEGKIFRISSSSFAHYHFTLGKINRNKISCVDL